MRKPGSKERIRQFLRAHVGETVTAIQIRDSIGTGVSERARRLRELREDEGWLILTHHDDSDLRPGEYLLKQLPPEETVIFRRTVSARLRAEVLDRNGFTCQMCGLCPGEIDPDNGRKVRLHIGHIKDKNLGGKDELVFDLQSGSEEHYRGEADHDLASLTNSSCWSRGAKGSTSLP